ncbi:MAG: hypothetical protein KF726_28115, partial [Anaerolineae bacterium]|nr:hypothetical protein [Anaerolineae bacterium]
MADQVSVLEGVLKQFVQSCRNRIDVVMTSQGTALDEGLIRLPSALLFTIKRLLITATKNDLIFSYGGPICGAIAHSIMYFRDHTRMVSATLNLFYDVWLTLTKLQQKHKRNISCGVIAFWISETYLDYSHDQGAATWWALHSWADDCRFEYDQGSAPHLLKYYLGVPQAILTRVRLIAVQCNLESHAKQFPFVFVEEIIYRLAIDYSEASSVFERPTNVTEHLLNRIYYSSLLDEAQIEAEKQAEIEENREVQSKNQKGKALEKLAAYLFLLIPGFVPRLRVKPEDTIFEIDAVVSNHYPVNTILSDNFGRYILIECKNRADKIGTSDIGYFLHRIQLLHATFGVLFARMGITDRSKQKGSDMAGHSVQANYVIPHDGQALLIHTYHENNITCIVITADD